jgi:predicted small lipoprotein YifL
VLGDEEVSVFDRQHGPRIMSLAIVVVAAFIAGCGSSGSSTHPPAANNAASTPAATTSTTGFDTPGAPAHPPSYQQVQANVHRILRADPTYTYVHAHLEVTNHFNCNWAPSGTGQCPGTFLGGSPPFDNVSGRTEWSYFAAGKVPIDPVRDGGIKITQVTGSKRMSCYIRDRSHGDCYTSSSQAGKPVGQPGGPLSLDAHMSSRPQYVLLRGFCRTGDGFCMPR